MEEHPVKQPIEAITVWNGNEGLVDYGAYEPEGYRVGHNNVTRIEACQKSGMHANIPYVRVWSGDEAVAEFCQHNITGVYFGKSAAELDEEAARCKRLDIVNIVNGQCTTCGNPEAECPCLPF